MIKLNVTSKENENSFTTLISGTVDASEGEIISMVADLIRSISNPIDDSPAELLGKVALYISLQDFGISKKGDSEK